MKNVIRVAAVILAAQLADRVAPKEIPLWRAGANPTDYGVHVWNERSIAEVLARYNERGNPILIDVEHNGAKRSDGKPAETGGYARLEVRAGVPWLVFDWSDYGRQQIESGERRFLSPEYDVDKNTGEILALYRVSLVADPGTHRARMLATASNGEQMDPKVILAALRAALAAEDPAVAKESISNLVAELSKSVDGGDGGDAGGMTDPSPDDAAVTTDTGDDNADDSSDDNKDKMAATTKPSKKAEPAKPAPVAQPKGDKVSAAADDAVRVIQNATRDHLLETQGGKLDPSIRRWASSQPLEVVRGLLGATPAKETTKTRAKATQGGGVSGLSERELAMCAEKKIDPAKYAETRARIAARSNGTGA